MLINNICKNWTININNIIIKTIKKSSSTLRLNLIKIRLIYKNSIFLRLNTYKSSLISWWNILKTWISYHHKAIHIIQIIKKYCSTISLTLNLFKIRIFYYNIIIRRFNRNNSGSILSTYINEFTIINYYIIIIF